MANMIYCRFQNTLADLKDCSEALGDMDVPDPIAKLSEDEQKAARRLFKLCADLAADYGDDA